MEPIFNKVKFKELILHIAARSFEDQYFGATKLNKLLYFADFLSYEERGLPITGASYQRLNQGPAPKEILQAIRELEAENKAEQFERRVYGKKQRRLIPKVEADLSAFKAEEIALVDGIIDKFKSMSATELSHLTHQIPGWQIAQDRETIPYPSVFLAWDPPTPRDLARGRELAETYGWTSTG